MCIRDRGGEVRERETKLCSMFNLTDSLKYLERGKQVEISRQQKCSGITIHKDYNEHCYVRRTNVMRMFIIYYDQSQVTQRERHSEKYKLTKMYSKQVG